MHLAELLIVLLAHLSMIQADSTCCMPTQFEAEKYFVEDKVNSIVVVDFAQQRAYETDTKDGKKFTIYDLEHNKAYLFDDFGCSFQNYDTAKKFPQCLTDESNYHGAIFIGTTRLYAYDNTVNDVHSSTLVTGPMTGCLPFISQTKGGDKTETIIYSLVNTTISNSEINTSLNGCVEKVMESNEETYGG